MSTKRTRRARGDPHAAREARRYERPIASREYLLEILAELPGPAAPDEIASRLGVDDAESVRALGARLRAMARDGQLVRVRGDRYGLAERMDLVRGRVVAHRDGFGFLVPEDAGEDLFLPARQMRSLMHGDRIVARVAGFDRRGRREGALVEVIERHTRQVVGRYQRESGIGFVQPHHKRHHQDVLVPPAEAGAAQSGQLVVAEILEQPTDHSQPIGRVVEVLGDHMAPGLEIDVAIRSHEIPNEWPAAVEAESARIGSRLPRRARSEEDREDLRDVALVTIDGEDARDFDDAVFCEPTAKGWRLLVAIADVSAYVAPGSALDEEARRRGNSVYFPGRVIPMLPEVLSNGLCSLNPEEDRLCMVAELLIGADGRTVRSRFRTAVMRSHARLTYDEVAAIVVDRDPRARRRRGALVSHLDDLYALYGALRRARESRGAIDLETHETRIVFGSGQKIERIEPLVRNDAHRVIEECMIAANAAAARFLERHRVPALYRVHEPPSGEKLTDLRTFLSGLGLKLGGGDLPQARNFHALLERVRGRPETRLVHTVVLRSLAQATYAPHNIGHFALALPSYVHFTSPIRRYPDLLVHRAIRHVLEGRAQDFPWTTATLAVLGEDCSATERRADEATRDAVEWLKCEHMLDKIGEEYDGLVTGVAAFGLFVELDAVFVEGLVHISELGGEYFHFDPVHHRLEGDRTGTAYRLGDRLRVRVARVDLDERRIDFELVQGSGKAPEAARARGGARRRHGRGGSRRGR